MDGNSERSDPEAAEMTFKLHVKEEKRVPGRGDSKGKTPGLKQSDTLTLWKVSAYLEQQRPGSGPGRS